MTGGKDYDRSMNLTVTDQSEPSGAESSSALLPVILSIIFILTAALLALIYVFKKNTEKRKSKKFEDIKDEILRQTENVVVKREVENSFEEHLKIPGWCRVIILRIISWI